VKKISDLFLDSCVFHSYAIVFERLNHKKSRDLFQNRSLQKYTSSNVKQEVDLKRAKRSKIYDLLLEWSIKGEMIESIPFDKYNIYLNDNDKRHLKSLFEYLSKEKEIFSTLRLFKAMYERFLIEAFNSLVEVCKSVNEPYLVHLLSDDIHREDAKIIVDAYYWSNGKNNPKFITIEREMIFCKRDIILRTLHDYCSAFPKTDLKLMNIHEIT